MHECLVSFFLCLTVSRGAAVSFFSHIYQPNEPPEHTIFSPGTIIVLSRYLDQNQAAFRKIHFY